GGTFTDWEAVPGWHDIGYPIAACRADGTFEVSKPNGTGGLIVPAVIAEQTLYEVGDPAAYILPDVIADFSGVQVTAAGPDRVRVTGARGRPPTGRYKVSATYQDGYRAVATVSIVGTDAARKAERTADALLARGRAILAERNLPDFTAVHVEALGAEASYGAESRARDTREVLLRLVVDHPSRDALDRFARELGSVGLSCAPGTTGIFSGRPKPVPVVRLFTFFVDKAALGPPTVQAGDAPPFEVAVPGGTACEPEPATTVAAAATDPSPILDDEVEVPLLALAYARSGDKGDTSNVAVIARDPSYLPVLRREVTPERVAAHFRSVAEGPVQRFEAPGLHALNFLIANALGGGGMASRRIDPQGKAYGQRMLEMRVRAPRALLEAAPGVSLQGAGCRRAGTNDNGRINRVQSRSTSGRRAVLAMMTAALGVPALAYAAEPKRVDLSFFAEHSATSEARRGIIDELADRGYKDGSTMRLQIQNAQGDFITQRQIAQKFVGESPDLIIAISTPTAQAMAAATNRIPVVFCTVTDPVSAKVVNSLEAPGRNLTGAGNMPPFADLLDLMQRILPSLKRVGTIYNPGEANSVAQIVALRKAAEAKGLTLVDATALAGPDVLTSARNLVGRADAVLLTQDILATSNLASVLKVGQDAGLPVFTSDVTTVPLGVVASTGVDLYKLGRVAGGMAAQVLAGANPATMPVQQLKATQIVVNPAAAAKMGVQIPASVLSGAERVGS
ncbi:MAG: acyclic terpene utilization AtuA family protein, partial [Acidisphaera sp.]|nr:acyclic terpene utilization AtuA family protein [Acidisphaera sp.]